jgi:hypothetical protein
MDTLLYTPHVLVYSANQLKISFCRLRCISQKLKRKILSSKTGMYTQNTDTPKHLITQPTLVQRTVSKTSNYK